MTTLPSGTRLPYYRTPVALSGFPTTRFGDTITFSSQACDEVWRHDYVTIAACGCEQLPSDAVSGNNYITIASLLL